MYYALCYNSAGVTSGTQWNLDTISQNGSNFSFSAGQVVTAAAGIYEVEAFFVVANVAGGTTGTQAFSVSAGTLTSSTLTVDYGTQQNAVSLFCVWKATAGGRIAVASSIAYSVGGLTIAAQRGQLRIRRIG
jgi:hypothetical protein